MKDKKCADETAFAGQKIEREGSAMGSEVGYRFRGVGVWVSNHKQYGCSMADSATKHLTVCVQLMFNIQG